MEVGPGQYELHVFQWKPSSKSVLVQYRISMKTVCPKCRDAIFPDFSGIPDFHKSKLSIKKTLITITNWKDLSSYSCMIVKILSQLLVDSLPRGAT